MFKLQHKENPKRSIWLVGELITLGSNSSNDWVLNGLGIEEFHAEISIHPDHLILKSGAGRCFVNNIPVHKEFQLASGDELKFGNERLLVIDPKSSVEPETAPQPVVKADTNVAKEVISSTWSLLPDHPKLQHREFSISGRCVLGRAKECDFSVPYKMLSREHASLTVVDNVLILQDLGSSNGCFVNGKQVQKVPLKGGDKISFAKLSFRVQAPSGVTAKTDKTGASFHNQDEKNKTVIRPAVDIQAVMAKEKLARGRKGSVTIEIEKQAQAKEAALASSTGFHVNRWQLMTVIGALVVLGVWFSPINPW